MYRYRIEINNLHRFYKSKILGAGIDQINEIIILFLLCPQVQFLSEQVAGLLCLASGGASLLAWCLEHPVSSASAPSVESLLATLRLPPLQEVVLCLGLAHAAARSDIR